MVTGGLMALGLSRSADLRRSASPVVEVAAGAAATVAAVAILAVLTLLPPGHVNL
jgi:hypothetical protein